MAHSDNAARTKAIADTLRTRYWSWTYYSSSERPATLSKLLEEKLPHVTQNSWLSRFAFGGIYVNGREAFEDQVLPTPCRVEYYEPKFNIDDAASVFPAFKEEYILFRDEHIIVAFKPAGLSSMPAKEQRHFSLKASIERITGTPIHMPSRLDVSAQGLVITSTSTIAHRALQHAFESRRVKKTYLCASHCKPAWDSRAVSAPIGRDPLHPVLRTIDTQSGKSAETIFQALGECASGGSPVHAFLAQPITGRTHQIRVHAASEGVPLVGDRFYGGAPASSLHLISFALNCAHPVSNKQCSFELPASLLPPWGLFASNSMSTRFEC